MKIINTSHNDIFFDCVKNTKKSIKLCSPFVKKQTVDKLLATKKTDVTLDLITNINLQSFYQNSSDISALESIQEVKGRIYNFQRLHAKIYIFDDNCSIITSANFTPSGLNKNYEYGMYIDESELVTQVFTDLS